MSANEGVEHEEMQAAALEEALGSIHTREFKILLRSEAFADLEAGVRGYWKLARAVARRSSAVVSETRDAGMASLGEITFFDTAAANLYGRGFTLRKRTLHGQGRPRPQSEILFEYRGPDALRAAGARVQAAPQYEGVEKLEEEILLVEGQLGGMRSLFSRSCRLKQHGWELGSKLSEASRVFPGLTELGALPTATLRPVGDTPIEELLFDLGSIDFGGRSAEVSMTVWRHAKTKDVLSGEFSFETDFRRYGRLESQPKLRSERFYVLLQKETEAWLDPGRTKTELVYAQARSEAML